MIIENAAKFTGSIKEEGIDYMIEEEDVSIIKEFDNTSPAVNDNNISSTSLLKENQLHYKNVSLLREHPQCNIYVEDSEVTAKLGSCQPVEEETNRVSNLTSNFNNALALYS